MIKTILWDNDGVLVDTEELYYQASKFVLKSVGVLLSYNDYISISLVQGKSVFSLIKNQKITEDTINKLRKERNRYYSKLVRKKVKVIYGVYDTLKMLHGKVKMGVVTGSLREHFNDIHAKSKLLKYFDFILAREDYKLAKPAPDSFLTAIKKYHLKKEECIIIEDTQRGVEAAHAAGIKCIAIPTKLTRRNDFSKADKILDDISEVPEYVFGIY